MQPTHTPPDGQQATSFVQGAQGCRGSPDTGAMCRLGPALQPERERCLGDTSPVIVKRKSWKVSRTVWYHKSGNGRSFWGLHYRVIDIHMYMYIYMCVFYYEKRSEMQIQWYQGFLGCTSSKHAPWQRPPPTSLADFWRSEQSNMAPVWIHKSVAVPCKLVHMKFRFDRMSTYNLYRQCLTPSMTNVSFRFSSTRITKMKSNSRGKLKLSNAQPTSQLCNQVSIGLLVDTHTWRRVGSEFMAMAFPITSQFTGQESPRHPEKLKSTRNRGLIIPGASWPPNSRKAFCGSWACQKNHHQMVTW